MKAKPEPNVKKKYSTFSSLLSSSLSTIKLVLGLCVINWDVSSFYYLSKVRSVSVYTLKILMKLVSTSGTKKSAVGHEHVNEQ